MGVQEAGQLQMGQVPALFVNGRDTQIVQVLAPCSLQYAVCRLPLSSLFLLHP